ncbi:histone-lysine N-methyltransferase NSD2 isoform X2 [Antennarius striatus]|uniref:histone-lysine N-methyltransferase NSD2 isoform X2 n=1 Tax=Antennarius striatus TaxID=241820 RepID=UPI0035B47EF9
MDSKGSSLPAMPEPANPVSMKQPPESLSLRKGSDPTLLMDNAAVQLAATLQDGVLQKMGGHGNAPGHQRLKDLTSRVLNGDQDALPTLCPPEPPVLKGAEVCATHGTHQHNHTPHPELELQVTVPQVITQPLLEPCCANGTSLAPGDAPTACEKLQDGKRRGRPHKAKAQAGGSAPPPTGDPLDHTHAANGPGAASQPDPIPHPAGAADASPLLASFAVGDLVWTKVSGYPWWPCMVTTDPECDCHFKRKQRASGKGGLLYHVQYFGENPERGYVFEKNMVSFSAEGQYQQLSRGNKPPACRLLHKKTPASVPRKLQAQWNTGVAQAKEALGLCVGERVASFSFLYDEGGPRLNPHVTGKLNPSDGSGVDGGGSESRLRPDLPPLSENDTRDGAKRMTPTAARKLKQDWQERGNGQLRDFLPADHLSNTEGTHLQPTPPVSTSPSSAPPQKRRRRPKRPPSPPNAVRRRKNAAVEGGASEPVKKRRPKLFPPAEDVSASPPVEKVRRRQKKNGDEPGGGATAPVKVERKTTSKRPLGVTAVDGQQPKKRRRISQGPPREVREPPREVQPSGELNPKQRRRGDPGVKEPRKRRQRPAAPPPSGSRLRLPAAPVAPPPDGFLPRDDPDPQKPKQRRRKQVTPQDERRCSPCPDPEGSGSEGRPDSPSDSLDGTKKGERRKEFVCQLCEQTGEDLVPCEGVCCGMFHLHCLGGSFKPDDKLQCQECSSGIHSCFKCKQSGGAVRRCHVPHCGKFYHEGCIRPSPLTVFDNKGFRCPLHACLGCYYGNSKNKSTKGRLMRCLRCPVAYHMGDQCVAAGSETLTNTSILCTNHFSPRRAISHHSHVNVSWCFVCSRGGRLLCCESCPAAFHPDCLNIAMPDGSWFCNDCRAGKKPKYRDIIWVKLGTYRWWPAEIQHPRNIPTNIQHLRHEIGEFPVFFFGSRDYFWTHQGRVFPYMEGDRGSSHQRTGIGKVFKNALLEAEARFKEVKMKREAREAQQNSRKPPPYKFIKVNKPVGGVQVYAADVSEIPKCNCRATDERPCGFESECLNRMLQYECHPQVCPSGGRCCNQDFTQRRYPDTQIVRTPGKGWGLVALRDIKKGEFVNEYVGEVIDEEECRARIRVAQENNVTHFYMLTIDKDRVIDAGPKGNYSRFMNHSCQPNCETQKWTVNGDTRVGLFAVCDIPLGTELTFNYNLDCLGNEKTVCRCGAPNCSGFLGDRPKNGQSAEPKGKRLKRKYRKRKSDGKKSEDECFRCRDGGQLVLCGKKNCTKAYHLTCLDLTKRPFGRWDCPWHHCDVCGKNSDAFCQLCPNSFCQAHQEGALRPWPPTGQLCCQEHDESDATAGSDQGPAPDVAPGVTSRPRGSRKSGAQNKTTRRKAAGLA